MLKGKVPLIVAVVLGRVAFWVSWSAIKKSEAEVRRGWNLVPVVVAAVDIAEGTTVTLEMLSRRSVPDQFVTSSVVKPDSSNFIVNQKAVVSLQAGEPVLWSHIDTTRAAERLSTKVQKKWRAITISAAQNASVGGWVRPNDRVDIIGTFKEPRSGEQVAITLMQNVVVLATGKITGTTNVHLIPDGQRDYGNVSLMVMPEEAEMLVLAQELGQLTMSLRTEDDLDAFDERGRTTIQTLLTSERIKVMQDKRMSNITVIRGTSTANDAHPVDPH